MQFSRQMETIRGSDIELDVFVVPWDSEIFGYPVAQIERIAIIGSATPRALPRQFGKWLERNEVQLASCRLASNRLRESMLLEAERFRFIEMVYCPILETHYRMQHSDGRLVIDDALPEDIQAIEAIAGAAFVTGRFVLDWRLDSERSNCRYQHWVRNSFRGDRHKVLKATLDRKLIGFFIVEERSSVDVYWHLTAIAPEWQGKGLGRMLWAQMAARHFKDGFGRIETTISAHNVAILNLYAALGFRFGSPQVTLHWVSGQ